MGEDDYPDQQRLEEDGLDDSDDGYEHEMTSVDPEEEERLRNLYLRSGMLRKEDDDHDDDASGDEENKDGGDDGDDSVVGMLQMTERQEIGGQGILLSPSCASAESSHDEADIVAAVENSENMSDNDEHKSGRSSSALSQTSSSQDAASSFIFSQPSTPKSKTDVAQEIPSDSNDILGREQEDPKPIDAVEESPQSVTSQNSRSASTSSSIISNISSISDIDGDSFDERSIRSNDIGDVQHPFRELQTLYLPVIVERNRTGFEESRDFQIVIGDVIANRYRIIRYLGSAAFSTAVHCIDLESGEEVCIKIIKVCLVQIRIVY